MTSPTGQMEQLVLTEVKGTAPGCQGPPWYLDNQDLPGSRALVVSKLGSKERAEPQAATESDYQEERSQEKAKRGEKQKWRGGKTSPPRGLWVLKLNDQCGLEREKMRK